MHIAQNINMTSVIDHAEKAVIIYLAPAYFGQIMCIIPEWFHVLLVDARKLNFIISDAQLVHIVNYFAHDLVFCVVSCRSLLVLFVPTFVLSVL